MDADDLCHDAADFGGCVELAFALAAFGGEVAHQIFVSIAQDVIAFRAVLAEIQRLVFKDGDQVAQPFDYFLAAAQFARIIKIRHVQQLVGIRNGAMIFLLIWSPMSGLPLSATISLKLAPFRVW